MKSKIHVLKDLKTKIMSKKTIYLFISFLVIGTMSCKKENQNGVILVKTINDGFNIDSFFYDNQNRIVKYINSIETSEYIYYNFRCYH